MLYGIKYASHPKQDFEAKGFEKVRWPRGPPKKKKSNCSQIYKEHFFYDITSSHTV